MAATFRFLVVTPTRTLYDGDAESAVIPAADGLMGVLPGHAPFLGLLRPGRVTVRAAEGELSYEVTGGTAQVMPDAVTILAEMPDATG